MCETPCGKSAKSAKSADDSSSAEHIETLKSKGIVPLNVYSVESIYYHPKVQKLAGEKLTAVVGGDIDKKLREAEEAALIAIRANATHLSNRIAEKAARELVFSLLPKLEKH